MYKYKCIETEGIYAMDAIAAWLIFHIYHNTIWK